MKKSIVLILVIAGLIWSCKKKSEDTVPPDPTTNLTGIEILKQTITPEGGTLTVENLTLEVPEGAFLAATTLTISRLDENPFGTDSKTPVYFVNNIPGNTAKDMVVSLSGLNMNDSLMILIAEPVYVKTEGKAALAYRRTNFYKENGMIKVILPAGPNAGIKSGLAEDETMSSGLLAAAGQGNLTSNEKHFVLTYPSIYAIEAEEIAEYLEEAYTMYSSAPFSLDFSLRSSWPLEVIIRSLKPDIWGCQLCSKWGDNYGFIELNTSKLNNMPEMKKTAVHEFFHVVQSWYDPRNRWSKATGISPNYWLDEASAVWIEERFASPGYISPSRLGNEKEQFNGGLNETRDKAVAESFGYGMSGTIKYLIDESGEGVLKKIYENIHNGYNAGESIRLAYGLSYYIWYGYMIDKYSDGRLYSDITSDFMVGANDDKFKPLTLADSTKTFSGNYKQLQSKIYFLDISSSVLTDQTELVIEAKQQEHQFITLYKFKVKKPLEFIEQDENSISVPKLKSLVNDGYRFIAVCTNLNYEGSSNSQTELSFAVRLITTRQYENITWHMIPAVLSRHYDKYGNLVETEETSLGMESLDNVPCTQNGNKLTASFPSPISGTMEITINPGNTLSFTVHYTTGGEYSSETIDCSASNVPFTVSTETEDAYWASEAFPCIQSFSGRVDQTSGGSYTYELIQKSNLDYGIVIKLKFKK